MCKHANQPFVFSLRLCCINLNCMFNFIFYFKRFIFVAAGIKGIFIFNAMLWRDTCRQCSEDSFEYRRNIKDKSHSFHNNNKIETQKDLFSFLKRHFYSNEILNRNHFTSAIKQNQTEGRKQLRKNLVAFNIYRSCMCEWAFNSNICDSIQI